MKLDPQSKYSATDIEDLIDQGQEIRLAAAARSRVRQAREFVDQIAASDHLVYGINTGFGRLAHVKIERQDLEALQINLLRSHAAGMGKPLAERIVRRLTLLRIIGLGKGFSGVSESLLQRHVDYFNHRLCPEVPEKGSVGASGDLAPLAHYALSFLGEGFFIEAGKRKSAASVLKAHSWKPIRIGPKEGLSLTNGTQVSLAIALEVLAQFRSLWPWVEAAAALSFEAHQATSAVLEKKIHELKAHRHQRDAAQSLYRILRSSPHMKWHKDCERVQDAYSFRCTPQVWGPVLSLFDKAEEMLSDEINSLSDNPLLFVEDEESASCGHFHAQYVSMAADLMSMAMVTLSNLTERRIDQVVNPLHQRSPAFQATRPGVESGLMIVQTAAAALASENKTMAFPASADSIPTNGDQEDHVSMAPWAGRKALRILSNLRRIVAAEILCGVRGCQHEKNRTNKKFSPFVENFLANLEAGRRELFISGDRVFSTDLEHLYFRIRDEDFPKRPVE